MSDAEPTVCVEIAVENDPRVLPAINCIVRQTSRRPDRILLAASPRTASNLVDAAKVASGDVPLIIVRTSGGVIPARIAAQKLIHEDITVFLDSDEFAPDGWLAAIIQPIKDGAAFSGGPTRPSRPPKKAIERYTDLIEKSIYDGLAGTDLSYLPLGNSAWRTEVVASLGFDPRILAEDHDLIARTLAAGYRGVFEPAAWVYHDAARETTNYQWLRKRYQYLVQMAMSLIKNGQMRRRIDEKRNPVRHPLRYIDAAMKPLAFVNAAIRWHRVSTPAERASYRRGPPRSPDAR